MPPQSKGLSNTAAMFLQKLNSKELINGDYQVMYLWLQSQTPETRGACLRIMDTFTAALPQCGYLSALELTYKLARHIYQQQDQPK